MPDIALLPLLAEVFGVSIDELFDLTDEQRLNRIENRMDVEEDLPQDVFAEYEEYLKALLADGRSQKRAADLLAYLYWHRMDTYARKTSRQAKEAIRLAPGEKGCQWMLQKACGYAPWDWNIANHAAAVEFYREMARLEPESVQPCYELLSNLIADHRTVEAEEVLERMRAMPGAKPVLCEVYRAHIALARFDEAEADGIIEGLIAAHPQDCACLFEAAQYYAKKCDYAKAVEYYERSFEKETRRPRFQDELMGIADICEITGDYRKAADTWGRIADLLREEWGMTEGVELQRAQNEKARLLEKARAAAR